MIDETIETLVEKLSCDFILATPDERASLSGLLPILKQIHGKCKDLSLDIPAQKVKKAKKIIKAVLKRDASDVDKKMVSLNDLISELSSSMYDMKDFDQVPDPEGPSQDHPTCSEIDFDRIEKILDKFSDLIGKFCPGEIPDLGSMLNVLEALISEADRCEPDTLAKVARACMDYVECMTLEDIYQTKPIEDGVVLLKALLRHMKKGAPFIFETEDVIELLRISSENEPHSISNPDTIQETGTMDALSDSAAISINDSREPEKISDDDMEILTDFISEAMENLENIEIYLVELEQDPTDKEIINNIFRPFHTIKGVSGFLSLEKINKLAHTTENLLDAARNDDFLINNIATNIILESVDTLKLLISRIGQGIANGVRQQDEDIDVDRLRKKMESLQISLTKGETARPIGEILVGKGIIDDQSLEESLTSQKNNPGKKIGEILIESKKVSAEEIESALMDQRTSKKQLNAQVKVSTEKLDDLVDYAGELVIAQSMLRQKLLQDPSLSQSVNQLNLIVSKIQHIAMSMRMIPIKSTFMKMIRLVRDLSQKSGKKVDLNMSGEDTEIDRNVVEALYEPMVHMIRNSMDHGIEPAEERQKKNKPARGKIHIRAYHKGGHIIIEIEDDGKGLDKDVILQKALGTGLVGPDVNLTDAQIYDLILQPGFSTAKKITDISGRGVGMDVVKDGIEKFRGHLTIDSTKGQGTKFTISLPLTLAIIDGMLVKIADDRYVIPTTAIQRAFKPEKKNCFTVENKAEMLKEGDNLIPLIRLKNIYTSEIDTKPPWEGLVVVVESKGEKRGLMIDELLGKEEFVIKSLGANLEGIQGLSGGAILGDGRVGLILDIQGIFNIAATE